jgi:hypothetical protein
MKTRRRRFTDDQYEEALRKARGIQVVAERALTKATRRACSRHLLNLAVARSPRLREAPGLAARCPAHAKYLARRPILGRRIEEENKSINNARDKIAKQVFLLGGYGSYSGSCAWHVLGLEMTLKVWATSRAWDIRPIGPNEARGVLTTALAVLTADSYRRDARGNSRRLASRSRGRYAPKSAAPWPSSAFAISPQTAGSSRSKRCPHHYLHSVIAMFCRTHPTDAGTEAQCRKTNFP